HPDVPERIFLAIDDIDGRGNLPLRVASLRITCGESLEETVGEGKTGAPHEGPGRRLQHFRTGKAVSLNTEPGPCQVARPGNALFPGEGRRRTGAVDHRELALLAAGIPGGKAVADRGGGRTFPEMAEAVDADIRVELRL